MVVVAGAMKSVVVSVLGAVTEIMVVEAVVTALVDVVMAGLEGGVVETTDAEATALCLKGCH